MNKQQNELNHEGGINYLEAKSAEEIKGVMGATEQADALSDLEPEGEVVGGALKGKPMHLVNCGDGASGGSTLSNHNETVESEEESEALADLPVKDNEQVKGGPVLAGEGKTVKIDFCKTD